MVHIVLQIVQLMVERWLILVARLRFASLTLVAVLVLGRAMQTGPQQWLLAVRVQVHTGGVTLIVIQVVIPGATMAVLRPVGIIMEELKLMETRSVMCQIRQLVPRLELK